MDTILPVDAYQRHCVRKERDSMQIAGLSVRLQYWSYCSLALIHRYMLSNFCLSSCPFMISWDKNLKCHNIWQDLVSLKKCPLISRNWFEIFESQRIFGWDMSDPVVSITIPANGLAPLGDRMLAGTVMTMFGSCTYMGPALKGLNSIIKHYFSFIIPSIDTPLCTCEEDT